VKRGVNMTKYYGLYLGGAINQGKEFIRILNLHLIEPINAEG
jgi:hypothetical protein